MTGATLDIWLAPLDLADAQMTRLSSLLSADESARASRFVIPEGRRRFVAGRAFLRLLLGQTLGCDPASLRFRYGEFGKPSLDGGGGPDFNLSHAGEVAAVAISKGPGGVGVDVERVRPLDDLEGVIRAAFPARQAARLLELPPSDRLASFYREWTRKEAVLKARGCGMSGESAEGGADAGWAVSQFEVGAGYVGAVASPHAPQEILQREWTWPSPSPRPWRAQ